MRTPFKDKNGKVLCVGDKIKVPDNPDIAPYDTGIIIYKPNHCITRLCKTYTDFLFSGSLSITPMDFYKSDEIELMVDVEV